MMVQGKRSCFAQQAAYLNVCYAIIKLHARPSHHEGQKTTDVVGWRRTIQCWFFYAAKSALNLRLSQGRGMKKLWLPGVTTAFSFA